MRVKKLKQSFGNRLVSQQDTQALEIDLKQNISIEQALQDASDLQIEGEFFNPHKTYFHGWSESNKVVLLSRDEANGKRVAEHIPIDWYFFITREDFEKVPEKNWNWLTRKYAKKVEPDPNHPHYMRIYVDYKFPKINKELYYGAVGGSKNAHNWAANFFMGERPRWIKFFERDRWDTIHHVLDWCHRKGITPLEADLTPKQRFLTDNNIRIQSKYKIGYFDIETDDSVGGFDNKENNRILSIAWEGSNIENDPSDKGFLCLAEETDEAEKEMLLEFKRRCINKYDVLAAWNGQMFDFPVVIYRFYVHKIRINWRYHLFADPLPIFKRHYVRSGSQGTSFALDNIGQAVLGIKKLDWREEFRQKFPGVTPKFINLYRYDKELLEKYNRLDATILRKLEDFTGFLMVEQLFCRLSNGFVNDFKISTKVDQLLLKKGFRDGYHFKTRYSSNEKPEKYEGSFVFEPKVGLHQNVCAFDFKSLYPSMVRAFNISPETIVKKEDRDKFVKNDLCQAPILIEEVDGVPVKKGGSTFKRDKEGFISQMFEKTLERRKKYTNLQATRLAETGTTQDDLYLLYYRLAYSFKRLGLSFYGDMGNPHSRFYDTELAESITLAGQYFIKETAKYALKFGYETLYGDTDSIFIQLAPDDEKWESEDQRIEDLVNRGNTFVEYCQKKYVKILKDHNCNLAWNSVYLEFEDIYDRIFWTSAKKRYAGRQMFHKGEKTEHIEVKGLEIIRSDTATSARNLQTSVLDAILMKRMSAEEIDEQIIRPEYERCTQGNYSLEEVTISKSISKNPENYKSVLLHVRLAQEIKDHGREYYVGMKIEYVVTKSKPKLDGILADEYKEKGIPYDYEYYWDMVTYPPTYRLLEVVFPNYYWDQYCIRKTSRRQTLIKRYEKWLRDKLKTQKAIEQIKENKGNFLTDSDINHLKRVPRMKILKHDKKET